MMMDDLDEPRVIYIPRDSFNNHWDVKGELILSRPLNDRKELISFYNKLNQGFKIKFPENPVSRYDLKREVWSLQQQMIDYIDNDEQYRPILDEIELNDRFDKIEITDAGECFLLSNDRIKLFPAINKQQASTPYNWLSHWIDSGSIHTSSFWDYLSNLKQDMNSIGIELCGELIITVHYDVINEKNKKLKSIRSLAGKLIENSKSLVPDWTERLEKILKELDPEISTFSQKKYKINIQDEELEFIKVSEESHENTIPKA